MILTEEIENSLKNEADIDDLLKQIHDMDFSEYIHHLFKKYHLKEADIMIFASPIYWFDMTAQLKTVIDRMYAGGSTGFHFHQTALLLDAGADHVFDAAISQYKAMTSYLKWEDLGIICVPNMENKGSMKESSKLGEVIQLAKSIK